MSELHVTRNKSGIKINVIITATLIAGVLFGMWLFYDVVYWLAIGGGVVAIGGGMTAVTAKTVRAALDLRDYWRFRELEYRERSALLWQADYIPINQFGNIAHNPATGQTVIIQPVKSGIKADDDVLQLAAPVQREGLLDLMPYAEHWLMVGSTQSGKTTAMIHLALAYQQQGARVTVLDIHASKNPWPFPAVGRGRDFEAVAASLQQTHTTLTDRSKTGRDAPALVVVVDEWPAVVDGCLDAGHDVRRYLRELVREGAKFGITIILAAHGDGVEDLGTQGRKSVRDNFQIVYFSHRDKSRNEARIIVAGERLPVDLPGAYHRQQTEEERIISAAFNGASYRAICDAIGMTNGGTANALIDRVLGEAGWVYDDRWTQPNL